MQKRDALGRTDFLLQKSALRAHWDSSSGCWGFGRSVRPRGLNKGQDTVTESLCEDEASLLSSRVNSGADGDSTSLATGESWSWDQALKFQAST